MNLLRDLVFAMDDDEGVPEAMYDALCNLISAMLGEKAEDAFSSCVDATNGRFYLKQGKDLPALCWQKMLEVAT